MARKATAWKASETNRARNADGSIRKRRTDRNHVVYQITCLITGDTYVGVTRALGRAYLHSAEERLRKHCRDAINEGREEAIHACIRAHVTDPDVWRHAFKTEVLCVVRGKDEGHAREIDIIRERRPSLNTEGTERKATRRRPVSSQAVIQA